MSQATLSQATQTPERSARVSTIGGTATDGTTSTGAARIPARSTTRLRITRRGRAVRAGLVAVPLVAATLVLALTGPGAFAGDETASAQTFEYLTVQAGQSMWDVAESLAPASDPRDVISAIRSLNQLESSSVSSGQVLAIPTKYSR